MHSSCVLLANGCPEEADFQYVAGGPAPACPCATMGAQLPADPTSTGPICPPAKAGPRETLADLEQEEPATPV